MNGRWNSTKVRTLDMQMHFGKHKGKTIRWIMENDPQYIEWATSQKKPVLVLTRQVKKQIDDEKTAQK